MKKRWDILLFCVIFTALGAIGGWLSGRQAGNAVSANAHEESAAAANSSPALPPATLKNLGVAVGEAKISTFTRYRSIPAVLQRTSSSTQPLFAPFGGRVAEVMVDIGMVVKPDDVIMTLVRDPIPRPTLTLTEEILKPAKESIHGTVADLRKSQEEIRITEAELRRVEQYTGKVGAEEIPILPRQVAIDLKYQLLRATKAAELAELELIKHGLTEEQIAGIATGGPIPDMTEDSWKRALKRNGLWPSGADKLYSALTEKHRPLPWVIATIGELSASGLNTPELVEWLTAEPEASDHFLQIGSLLQRGHSVTDLRRLHAQNAFESIIRVMVPKGAPDWIVDETQLRPGAQVEAGTTLLTLLNPRVMYLRIAPIGSENGDALRALANNSLCEARPLDEGSGPNLSDVRLSFATGMPGALGGTTILAEVKNSHLTDTTDEAGRVYRSWQLREGIKYMVRIPTSTLENVFVLPTGAVAVDGPHKVVFIQDGPTFRDVQVEIAYQDEEVAVIQAGKDTALFPGDPVVTSGAFSLGIALKSGAAKADAHAGHQH
jgi:multidrug efflux pump subunit AcrA (membrane-fusion protein)